MPCVCGKVLPVAFASFWCTSGLGFPLQLLVKASEARSLGHYGAVANLLLCSRGSSGDDARLCGRLDHAGLQTYFVVRVINQAAGHVCAGARDVLLMKLWATVFPVSDKRHPVTTPLALLVSSNLALCPVTCHRDAAIGKRSPKFNEGCMLVVLDAPKEFAHGA